jgi:hypothetical protein
VTALKNASTIYSNNIVHFKHAAPDVTNSCIPVLGHVEIEITKL